MIMEPVLVYAALGSNLGNRLCYLKTAVSEFRNHPDINNVISSQVYESAPVDLSDQPAYLNAVLKMETTLDLSSFFRFCQEIEKKNGRNRLPGERWKPRTLDVDILFWGDLISGDEDLTIPHPEIMNRSFVLVPLFELDKEFRYPGTGEELKNRIGLLSDKPGLHLFSDPL